MFGSESSDFSAFHQASLQAVQYVLPVLTSAAFKAYLRAKRSRACLEDSYANLLRILTLTWIWNCMLNSTLCLYNALQYDALQYLWTLDNV